MTVDELRMNLKDEIAELVRAPGAPLHSSTTVERYLQFTPSSTWMSQRAL